MATRTTVHPMDEFVWFKTESQSEKTGAFFDPFDNGQFGTQVANRGWSN